MIEGRRKTDALTMLRISGGIFKRRFGSNGGGAFRSLIMKSLPWQSSAPDRLTTMIRFSVKISQRESSPK